MDVSKSPHGVIEATYQALRNRLVKGELRPDTKLKISDISQMYSMPPHNHIDSAKKLSSSR